MNLLGLRASRRFCAGPSVGPLHLTGACVQRVRGFTLIELLLVIVILGILIGNAVSSMLKSHFIIPWIWVTMGIIVCFIVGVVSGYAPAVKAANIDPIEALRYE